MVLDIFWKKHSWKQNPTDIWIFSPLVWTPMQTRIHYLHMHHICIQVATWKNLDQAFWDNDGIIFFFIFWCTASPIVVKEIQWLLYNWPSMLPPALGPWWSCRVGPHARECDPHLRWPNSGWLPSIPTIPISISSRHAVYKLQNKQAKQESLHQWLHPSVQRQ